MKFVLDGWDGEAVGGFYYRSFDFNKFMKLLEEKKGKVVALDFDGNEVNLFVEVKK